MIRRFLSAVALTAVAAADALAAAGPNVTALTTTNQLIVFNSSLPGTINSTSPIITGVTAGQSIVAIDYRPLDGVLVGFGYNSGTGAAGVYTLNPTTGVATSINTVALGTGLTRVTADFNPTANALRIVTSATTGNNLRVPTGGTGTLATDTALTPATGGTRATAYSRNVPGGGTTPTTGATTLYAIDSTNGLEYIGSIDFSATSGGASPNTGAVTNIGISGVTAGTVVGFDIYSFDGSTPGSAYVATANTFYNFNLSTGAAANGITIGGGNLITDFATQPVPEPGSMALLAGAGLGLGRLVWKRRKVAAV